MILETAAVAGVEPWQYTWRELLWMANARIEAYVLEVDKAQWMKTSELMALLINIHKGKKAKTVVGADLDPYRRQQGGLRRGSDKKPYRPNIRQAESTLSKMFPQKASTPAG